MEDGVYAAGGVVQRAHRIAVGRAGERCHQRSHAWHAPPLPPCERRARLRMLGAGL